MNTRVHTVSWVYIVSWVIKFKKLNELKKPKKLFRRNGLRNQNPPSPPFSKGGMGGLLLLFALCPLLIFVCGCGGGPKYYTKPNFELNNIKRVAVLPFDNFTSDEYAGEKIRKPVITELLSRGIDVIEPGEVTKVLRELKIKSLSFINITDIQNLGKTLGVETVMMGSVEAFGISKGISVSYPEVSINLMLVEASSGNIIWSIWHTAGGPNFWTRHFGAEGITLSEAANKVVKEAIDTLF
jgi:TolB-like protein